MKKSLLTLLFLFSCTLAFSQEPKNDAYFEYLQSLTTAEKYDKVLASLDSAIKASPQNADFYFVKASLLNGLLKYFDALDVLNKCLKNTSEAALAHLMRGGIFDVLGETDAAILEFEQSVIKSKNDKHKSRAYSNLGASKMKKRKIEEAYSFFKKAIDFDKDNLDALNNFAACASELGKKEEALNTLESVVKIDPKYVPGYTNLGYYHLTEKNYTKAIDYFNQANALDPSEAFAYNNRGYCQMQLGKLKEAMQDVEKSIELNPMNPYAYRNRALIYLKEKNTKAACEAIEKGLLMKFTEMYGNELEELKSKHCK